MLRRTEGIVLKNFPYGEADLIVTFLTPRYGIVKAFAKSPRKTKSRFGSSLEPLTHCMLSLHGKENANLPRLTQADIIEPFQGLRESLGPFQCATDMCMLCMGLLPEGESNETAFELLRQVLKLMLELMLEAGGDQERLDFFLNLYRVRFLDMAGYSPRLKGCARCGTKGFGFVVVEGSVMCGTCSGDRHKQGWHTMEISPGSVKLYESMRSWDMSAVKRIRPSGAMLLEISRLLDAHITHIDHRAARGGRGVGGGAPDY